MLNNKYPKQFQEDFHYLPYEQKVKIFDINCGSCPWKVLKTEFRGEVIEHKTISSVINEVTKHATKDIKVIRGCSFGWDGETYDLDTVISNGCNFWFPERCESNNNEAEEVEELDVKRFTRL